MNGEEKSSNQKADRKVSFRSRHPHDVPFTFSWSEWWYDHDGYWTATIAGLLLLTTFLCMCCLCCFKRCGRSTSQKLLKLELAHDKA